MNFSVEEKNAFLRAFTTLLKEANGKGPKNIYIRYLPDEIHVVMQGVVSDFEKYLIKNFGEEAIGVLTNFYERDCLNSEERFLEILGYPHGLKFYHLDSDFKNDVFVYKMRICE